MKKFFPVILLYLSLIPQSARAWEYFAAFKENGQPASIRACSDVANCTEYLLDDARLVDPLGQYNVPEFINYEAGTSNLHFFVANPSGGGNHWALNLDDGSLTSVSEGNSKITGVNSEPHDFTNGTLSLSGRRSFVRKISEQIVSLVSSAGDNIIKNTSDGIEIGSGASSTIISSEGVSLGGSNLIKRSGGVISIGENSLKLREQDGRQQMWATDADDRPINIDIVNGSDFLIDGKSVQGQIDSNSSNISSNASNISSNASNIGSNAKNISDLGAGIAAATSLTAALSALPAASSESPVSCGVGTGGYSDKFALGVGCAARISQRLNANIAASHVFGGSVDYGDGSLDTVAARAGFVFKFGRIDDSPKVAARKAAELHDKVAKLEESNQALNATNLSLMKFLQAQSARLDNLEKIASGQLSLLGDRALSD